MLRFGLIGCGRIGQVHAKNLVSRVPNTSLVGVTSTSGVPTVLEACRGFGCEPLVFGSAQELIAQPDVDAVIICSPSEFHAEQCIWAAEAGKHVYLEKPVVKQLRDLPAVEEAVARSGIKVVVGMNRRFDSNAQEMRRQMARGVVGDVRSFLIASKDPSPPPAEYLRGSGGVFFDMISHDLDMARFLTGCEVESVSACGARFSDAMAEADDFECVSVNLHMANGAIGTITGSRSCSFGYDQRMEVLGSQGFLQAENKAPHAVSVGAGSHLRRPDVFDFFFDRYTESYVAALAHLADCIRDSTLPVQCSLDDGRQALRLAEACDTAARNHTWVPLTGS